jgi:alkaline phosphatase D
MSFGRFIAPVMIILMLILFSQCRTIPQPDEYYCSLLSGEPTQTSVILQARLHRTDTLINNDIPGIEGFVKFEITRDINSSIILESPFFNVKRSSDFIAKYEFTGLRPSQRYFYRAAYGRDTSNVTHSSWYSFKSLEQAFSDKGINFAIIGGPDYSIFKKGKPEMNVMPASTSDLKKGFPSVYSVSFMKPEFCIACINSVGSGSPDEQRADWHRLLNMKDLAGLLSVTPVYWTSEEQVDENASSFSDTSGVQVQGLIYREELPVPEVQSGTESSFRSYRLNRDVQIWFINGDLFKDSGKKNSKLNWLKSTLKESEAPFMLLVSPKPFIGPDLADSTGKSSYLGENRTQRDSLFLWLKNNGFKNNGLYFICTGLKWQYHSDDPFGFEEFSCGTLLDASAIPGIVPGDVRSTDIAGLVHQAYLQSEPGGGFLLVNSARDEYNSPVIMLRFYDDQRKLLYAVNKF